MSGQGEDEAASAEALAKRFRLRLVPIEELRPDPNNTRVRNARAEEVLAESFAELGAGRGVVLDGEDTLVAGNGATEAAKKAGIKYALVVEHEGDTLVATKRPDLDEFRRLRMALYDNKTADLSDFDNEVLADLMLRDDVPLFGIFTPDEMDAIDAAAALAGDDEEPAPKRKKRRTAFRLDFDDAEQKRRFEGFRKYLTHLYGEETTEAERFDAFIREHVPQVNA